MANSAEFTSELQTALSYRDKPMRVTSTVLKKAVLLAALGLFTGQKVNAVYGSGIPEGGALIQGLEHDQVRVDNSELAGTYEPLIMNSIQRDFKNAGWRDTVTTESVAGTAPVFTITVDSNGQITAVTSDSSGGSYSGANPTLMAVNNPGYGFGHGAVLYPTVAAGVITAVTVSSGGSGYTSANTSILVFAGLSSGEMFQRPILHPSMVDDEGFIYQNDIDGARNLAAKNGVDEKAKVLDLTGDSAIRTIGLQAQGLDNSCMRGSPSSESAQMWSDQYGLLSAIDDGATTAVYCGVDRSLSANWWWRAPTIATGGANWGLDDFVDSANLTYGLMDISNGINLVIDHPLMHKKWKKQGVAQLVNINQDDRLRELVKFGFESEVLCYGRTYALSHPAMPPTTVLGINTDSLLFKWYGGYKFKPSKFYDLRATSAGKRGLKYHIETQYIFSVIPNLNFKATGLSLN